MRDSVGIRPASQATKTIPIVIVTSGDPVAAGLIDSLARPEENIAGLSNVSAQLAGKRLELLKEIIPKLARIAVLRDLTEPGSPQGVRQIDLAAQRFGLQRHYVDVRRAGEIEPAFLSAGKKQSEALLVLPSAIFNSHRKQIVELAANNRGAGMYPRTDYVEDGGLMTYALTPTIVSPCRDLC